MLLTGVAIFIGFIGLMWSADRFVFGASALAKSMGISPMLVGLTIVALGTSAPEIFISLMAALGGHTGLAVGNAVGSNIANIGLVLGITALITPIAISSKTLRREFCIMLAIMLFTTLLLLDGVLGRFDAIILLLIFVLFLAWLIYTGIKQRNHEPMAAEYAAEMPGKISNTRAIFWLILGLVLLALSSELLVQNTITLAKHFGISELTIGLTVIAIGTSLPEIATSVISALKNEADIAVGNIIGSNIFNMVIVLAIPGLIHPSVISKMVVYRDLPVMLLLSALLFLTAYGFRKKEGIIQRWEGGLLLLAYLTYLGFLIW